MRIEVLMAELRWSTHSRDERYRNAIYIATKDFWMVQKWQLLRYCPTEHALRWCDMDWVYNTTSANNPIIPVYGLSDYGEKPMDQYIKWGVFAFSHFIDVPYTQEQLIDFCNRKNKKDNYKQHLIDFCNLYKLSPKRMLEVKEYMENFFSTKTTYYYTTYKLHSLRINKNQHEFWLYPTLEVVVTWIFERDNLDDEFHALEYGATYWVSTNPPEYSVGEVIKREWSRTYGFWTSLGSIETIKSYFTNVQKEDPYTIYTL